MRSGLPLSIFGVLLTLLPCLAEVKSPSSGAADDMSDIRDIYGPVVLPDNFIWFYMLIGAALLLIMAVLFFFLFKRRKTETAGAMSPHEHALIELERAERYIEKNQSLLYAEKVSEVLRVYLEKRFDLHSTRQTTREFLDSLVSLPREKQDVLLNHRQALQMCLEQCDLAKYAQKTSGQESMRQLKTHAVNFVKETVAEDRE